LRRGDAIPKPNRRNRVTGKTRFGTPGNGPQQFKIETDFISTDRDTKKRGSKKWHATTGF
jgi:hypothetical protein